MLARGLSCVNSSIKIGRCGTVPQNYVSVNVNGLSIVEALAPSAASQMLSSGFKYIKAGLYSVGALNLLRHAAGARGEFTLPSFESL